MKKSLRGLGTQQATPKSSTEVGWEHFKTMASHGLLESKSPASRRLDGVVSKYYNCKKECTHQESKQFSEDNGTCRAALPVSCAALSPQVINTAQHEIAALHSHTVPELSARASLFKATGRLKARPPV